MDLEGQHEGSNTSSLGDPLVDEEVMRPVGDL